jgi:hypothetical protein
MLFYVILCYVMLCYFMLFYATLCYVNCTFIFYYNSISFFSLLLSLILTRSHSYSQPPIPPLSLSPFSLFLLPTHTCTHTHIHPPPYTHTHIHTHPPPYTHTQVLAHMSDSSKCSWESKKVRQTSHEWVFDLVERCREVVFEEESRACVCVFISFNIIFQCVTLRYLIYFISYTMMFSLVNESIFT